MTMSSQLCMSAGARVGIMGVQRRMLSSERQVSSKEISGAHSNGGLVLL